VWPVAVAGGRRSAAAGAHSTANPRKSRGGVFSGRPMTAAVADTLRPSVDGGGSSKQLLHLCV